MNLPPTESNALPADGPTPVRQQASLERLVTGLPLGVGPRLAPLFAGDGLKAKAMRGSVWTMVGFGTGQVLRLGSNLILTRLLAPEAFGLLALVQVVLQGLQMLSDMGINASIIQNNRGDDPDFLNTAWTLQIIRGAILWLFAVALAWPVALFYVQPELVYMIPVASLAAVISGFDSTAIAQLNRHVILGRITALHLGTQVCSVALMISLTLWLRNVWALVIGGVIASLINTIAGHLFLPGIRHRLHIDRAAVGQIIHFGKWLFVATAAGYLGTQAIDKLIIGKLVGTQTLGVYSIAFMMCMVPASIVATLMGRIFFPVVRQAAASDPQGLPEKLREPRRKVCLIGACLTLLLAVAAPLFFYLLYPIEYGDAIWMSVMLSPLVLLTTLHGSLNSVLLALGDSRTSAVLNVLGLATSAVALNAGYYFAEVPGMILGLIFSGSLWTLFMHLLIRRHRIWVVGSDLPLLAMSIGLAGLGYWLA